MRCRLSFLQNIFGALRQGLFLLFLANSSSTAKAVPLLPQEKAKNAKIFVPVGTDVPDGPRRGDSRIARGQRHKLLEKYNVRKSSRAFALTLGTPLCPDKYC